jgi:hypothetical protein
LTGRKSVFSPRGSSESAAFFLPGGTAVLPASRKKGAAGMLLYKTLIEPLRPYCKHTAPSFAAKTQKNINFLIANDSHLY